MKKQTIIDATISMIRASILSSYTELLYPLQHNSIRKAAVYLRMCIYLKYCGRMVD